MSIVHLVPSTPRARKDKEDEEGEDEVSATRPPTLCSSQHGVLRAVDDDKDDDADDDDDDDGEDDDNDDGD
eukprot:6463440-Pyramimonas_sp.AAC.1